jgi:hypothetical protein
MEFAIATVDFWKSVGFDTDNWRKSIDNTQAIVHLPYALTLVPSARTNKEITIYQSPSQELTDLLSSSVWQVT